MRIISEDFKDLEKTRVENEIYKILALKIFNLS